MCWMSRVVNMFRNSENHATVTECINCKSVNTLGFLGKQTLDTYSTVFWTEIMYCHHPQCYSAVFSYLLITEKGAKLGNLTTCTSRDISMGGTYLL